MESCAYWPSKHTCRGWCSAEFHAEAARLQLSTTVMQVRIHVHMEVFPSSLLFKQGLNLTFTNDPVSRTSIDKVTQCTVITIALHSYFQDNSSLHYFCCAFAFCVGTSVSLPLISTGSAAVPIRAEVWVWHVAILIRKLGLQQLNWKFCFSKAAYCMSHLCCMQASEARLPQHTFPRQWIWWVSQDSSV